MRIRTALVLLGAVLAAAETAGAAARADAPAQPRSKAAEAEPAPAPEAPPPTFEVLAADAQAIADVGAVLGALVDKCPDDGRTLDRARCRASQRYLRQNLPERSFAIAVGDPAAISVSDYDDAIKGYRVALSACLACTSPIRVGRSPDPVFVTVKKPVETPRVGEALAAAVEIASQPLEFPSDAVAKRWLRDTRPHLRAELIVGGTASEWRFRSSRGYALTLVAGRVVDDCTGTVVLSVPPSTGRAQRSASSGAGAGCPPAKRSPAIARAPAGTTGDESGATGESGESGDDEQRPLPIELSRNAIADAMGRIRTQIFACFQQYRVPGTAPLTYEVAGNGSIQAVGLTGPLTGTPTGDCLLEAARGARFPPFDSPVQTFTYPFFLRR